MKTVFEKLDSSNFKEAVAVFKMAGKKWPECFQIDESDENEDSEMPDEAAEKQRYTFHYQPSLMDYSDPWNPAY